LLVKSNTIQHIAHAHILFEQVLKITALADRLAEELDGLEWPEGTMAMQRAWIGRSEGAEIDFAIESETGDILFI